MYIDLEKLDSMGRSYNLLRDDEWGFWMNFCKKGNLSWKRASYFEYPKTILNTCELCNKTSTPKKVNYRSEIWGWDQNTTIMGRINYNKEEPGSKSMLCTSCWNKVKPIAKKQDEMKENQRLINKLNREILAWQKSQTQAN